MPPAVAIVSETERGRKKEKTVKTKEKNPIIYRNASKRIKDVHFRVSARIRVHFRSRIRTAIFKRPSLSAVRGVTAADKN